MNSKNQVTIKIRRPTRERLQKLSRFLHEPMVDILERLIVKEFDRVELANDKGDK